MLLHDLGLKLSQRQIKLLISMSMVHASLWLPVFVEVKLTIVDESLVALVLGAHHCKLLLDMVY